MQTYLDLLRRILDEGVERGDRTGTGTLSVFGHQMRFDLSAGFPAVTTKRLHWPSIIHELLWFLSGDTNVGYLQENKVRIWNEWADENGDLGPSTVNNGGNGNPKDGRVIDQIAEAIELIKIIRQVAEFWSALGMSSELEDMASDAMSCLFSVLCCRWQTLLPIVPTKRRCISWVSPSISHHTHIDTYDGTSLWIDVGDFVHTIGDAHLYLNHLEQAQEQITREPLPLPTVKLDSSVMDIDAFTAEHIEVEGYEHHPHIAAPISV